MTDHRREQDRDKREIEKKDWGRGDFGEKRNENEVSFDRPIPQEKPKKD